MPLSLGDLLGTAQAKDFRAALERRTAWLDRGAPQRFAALFDEQRLLAALRRMPFQKVAPAFGAIVTDPLGDGLTFTEAIAPDEVAAWMQRGHTICADDVSAHDARLASITSAIAASLAPGDGVRFNAYLSPSGARTPFHFDTRASTTFQLEGRKRWRFARTPSVGHAMANAQIDRFGDPQWMAPVSTLSPPPLPAELDEIVLAPGDLLSVPAGAWHEVCALERGLALNLSIRLAAMP